MGEGICRFHEQERLLLRTVDGGEESILGHGASDIRAPMIDLAGMIIMRAIVETVRARLVFCLCSFVEARPFFNRTTMMDVLYMMRALRCVCCPVQRGVQTYKKTCKDIEGVVAYMRPLLGSKLNTQV